MNSEQKDSPADFTRVGADVFISYSRKDMNFVRRLNEALERYQQKTWVDLEDIRPAEEWSKRIDVGIESANNFIFVISANSLASPECERELAHAVEHGKRIVPVVYGDVDPKKAPAALANLNLIFSRGKDDFENALKSVVQALTTDLLWVNEHTRLETRAVEWHARARKRSLLLTGDELQAAEVWLIRGDEKKPKPTQLQHEYIQASRRAADRSRQLTIAVLSAGLLVALCGLWSNATKRLPRRTSQ